MKKYRIGYTQGVYDMFHIGHLNLLNNAKKCCEKLIVGVNSDELVKQYKNKTPIINQEDRKKIVENIKAVDQCIIVDTLDKTSISRQLNCEVVFIGSDWKGSERWNITEEELKKINVDVIYLPHTDGVCSTELRKVENEKIKE